MILVDTSVWVSHLHNSNSKLEQLLNDGDVVCHPFIIGELACGNIKNRRVILSLLSSLPMVEVIDNEEVLLFIENKNLMGKGIGLIDVHLLATTLLNEVSLWTLDTKLQHAAAILRIAYKKIGPASN
ncbi:MAG: type II toxin-antitoxin system VapC family toxin [Candidatus Ratteibacteria bacterium]|nr:type II toxin-antitoxin system VapC family toxin [Candidatus Ratteibacteria bacterium]